MRCDVDVEARLARIEAELSELEERLDRIERLLYGNSGDGVQARLAKLEERVRQLDSRVKLALTFTIGTFLGIIVTLIALLARLP